MAKNIVTVYRATRNGDRAALSGDDHAEGVLNLIADEPETLDQFRALIDKGMRASNGAPQAPAEGEAS